MTSFSFFRDFSLAWGGPLGRCCFKSAPEDFIVDEELPFEPDGEGEHLFLFVEKIGENTDWVAGWLARYAGVQRSAVSYAGRKDRQGVTRQWFCISLPGKSDPDWSGFDTDTIKIIRQSRHRRKLRTGALKSNRFRVTLRNIQCDHADLDRRLDLIVGNGVPNYFGDQRFGRDYNNLDKAISLFEGRIKIHRNKRSMYLSAARSWLFNALLSERVVQKNWNKPLVGDVFGFQDNNTLIIDDLNVKLSERIAQLEVTPTGPLWGRGSLLSTAETKQLEEMVCGRYRVLCDGLEHVGLQQERRALRLLPDDMYWDWLSPSDLVINFRLPKGCFATAVLRELLVCEEGRE